MSDRANYVGAPQVFYLNQACRTINDSFDGFGCFLVGSSLVKRDWRDVDVRFIMDDGEFDLMFPNSAGKAEGSWVYDAKWSLLCAALAEWLSKVSGLPVDFQFQRQTQANEKYPSREHSRSAIGLVFATAPTEPPAQGEFAQE